MYKELQISTAETLKELGQLLTFTRETEGDIDPGTGMITNSTKEDFKVNCAVFDYTAKNAGVGVIEGTTIKTGDKRILAEAGGYTPSVGDTTVIGGNVFSVNNYTEVNPAGIPVMYEIQVRK